MKRKCFLCHKPNLDNDSVYCKKCQNYFERTDRIGINRNVIFQLKNNIRKYEISIDQYLDLFETQNGVCAICKKVETRKISGRNEPTLLAIDHNHKTGKIRGLLCFTCNKFLGKYEKDINSTQMNKFKWVTENFLEISNYLEKYLNQ